MRVSIFGFIGCASLALAGCAGAQHKLAKAPSRSEARSANPNGSVLVPVRETPATRLLSDEILPLGGENNSSATSSKRRAKKEKP